MTKLYNITEGRQGRPEGEYFENEFRKGAEELRAQREGREPNLDNPPPYVGDVLVPADRLPGSEEITVEPAIDTDPEVPEAPIEGQSVGEPQGTSEDENQGVFE